MTQNWGTGEGVSFQKVSKDCPSFAAQFAAVTMRSKYQHYGPINRREVEIYAPCSDMLAQIESMISPKLCEELK